MFISICLSSLVVTYYNTSSSPRRTWTEELRDWRRRARGRNRDTTLSFPPDDRSEPERWTSPNTGWTRTTMSTPKVIGRVFSIEVFRIGGRVEFLSPKSDLWSRELRRQTDTRTTCFPSTSEADQHHLEMGRREVKVGGRKVIISRSGSIDQIDNK